VSTSNSRVNCGEQNSCKGCEAAVTCDITKLESLEWLSGVLSFKILLPESDLC